MQSSCCLCVCVSPSNQLLNTWTNLHKTWYVCHGIWAPLNGYFINPSHQSLCLYLCPSYRCQAKAQLNVSLLSMLDNGSVNMFLRQVIQVTRQELLDASFSVLSVPYQKESLCIPLSLLCKNSVKTFPRQRRIDGPVIFNAVRVVSKKQAIISSQKFLFFLIKAVNS
jgi:hypothetical protein